MISQRYSILKRRALARSGLFASLLVAGCCLLPPAQNGNGGDTPGDGNGGGNGDGSDTDVDRPPPTSISVGVIVQTGDAVPEQSGASFTYFGNPVIDDAGRVAFYAAYQGGRGDGGLYVWQDGTLQRIYDSDPSRTGLVPALGADAYLGGFTVAWDGGSPHLAWGANGRLLYAAHISGSPQPDALLRWRARDGDVFLVSSPDLLRTVIPDATEDFLPEMYHPGVSDDGLAIFSSRYSFFREDGSFALFQRGIFTTDGRTTKEIGIGAVPANAARATFSDKPVLLTTHNAEGDFLFQAGYDNGEGDRGVYLFTSGDVFRVIDNAPNRSFPGLPEGAQVGAAGENFSGIAIGKNGQIAIDTTLTTDSATRDTVLLWDNSRWRELQGSGGQAASDLLGGVTDDGRTIYLAAGRPFFGNGQDSTGLSEDLPAELTDVSLTWESFGGAVNNDGRALLRFRRATLEPGIVFWSGEQLFLVIDATQPFGLDAVDVIFPVEQLGPDEVDRVGTVAARPELNRPELSGILNARDEFVFRAGSLGPDGQANTADDEQAIFLGRGQ